MVWLPPLEPVQAAAMESAGGPARPSMENLGVEAARAMGRAAAAATPPGPAVRFVEDLIIPSSSGPVPVRRYCTVEEPAGSVVYLHSGGWVLGDLDTCDHIVRHLARASGLEYWSVDYRLAPEFRAPAALDDARAVLRHVAAQGRPVVLHGDSAGGALAAVLSQEQDPAVASALRMAVLVYPVVDADLARSSYVEATGGLLAASDMRWFWSLYAPERDLTVPQLSPLRGNLAAACRTLVITAGHDPLRDEGRAYAAGLAAVGRLHGLHEFEDCSHSFLNFAGLSRRAEECLHLIAASVRAECGCDL